MLGIAGSAHATQTTTSYNVAPGACSLPIAIPANNKPVTLSVSSITNFNRATASATIVHVNGYNNPLVAWSGVDSVNGVESNNTNAGGATIVYADASGYTTVQTASVSAIKVCNSNSNPRSAIGYITFSY